MLTESAWRRQRWNSLQVTERQAPSQRLVDRHIVSIHGRAGTREPNFLPDCIDDYVGTDNPVRVIEAFVEQLKTPVGQPITRR